MLEKIRKPFFSKIIGGLALFMVHTVGSCAVDLAHGAELWKDNCSRCHNPRPSSEFSSENWQTIMSHMRLQAGLTGLEARDVLAFLAPEYASTQVTAESPVSTDKKTLVAENSSPSATPKTANGSANTASKLSGKDIYNQTCVACHGANGKGAIPGAPDLTQSSGPLSQSTSTLISHIKNGFQKPGDPMAMPPKGGNSTLTDEDIQNVLDYIEKSFKH